MTAPLAWTRSRAGALLVAACAPAAPGCGPSTAAAVARLFLR